MIARNRFRGASTVAAVLALVVSATLLTACTDTPPVSEDTAQSATPSSAYEVSRSEGAQRLLDALGPAIRDGDRRRLDPLIDPSASPSFRATLTTAVDNLAPADTGRPSSTAGQTGAPPAAGESDSAGERRGGRLRPRLLEYRLTPVQETEPLVPPEIQARLDEQGSSDAWVAPVEIHHALGGSAIPGIDEPEIVSTTTMILARYGDDWKVVGDYRGDGAAPPPVQLWELPGVRAADVRTAGGASVIASYPDTADTVTRVRSLLPNAVDAVTEFWGDAWPRRAVVVATGDNDQFGALTRSLGSDVAAAAAATVYADLDSAARTVTGQRVVLTPAAGTLSAPALGVVLRHELTHVAARTATAPGAPLWITEGVPEYVGRRGTYTRFADAAPQLAARVRAGEAPTAFPTDADFAVDSEQATIAYQSAWSVAAFVADRFDETVLRRLYIGVAGTDDVGRQDAAITNTLKMSRAQLVERWRAWLTEQVR
ncbi:hypothetical protein [Gordonia soli]|uniref:Peptidase MA-like domain-containing protein n=1 Tax=Gordonia soli NBRC 108243 TaxID=1223545 RepID=M0QM80_9ACTN|nr:hypothetical protein [Gordonia soli]GAC69524.1 hypothetical protein GS4_25_00960 [Gordonia soli NBRC 108243]